MTAFRAIVLGLFLTSFGCNEEGENSVPPAPLNYQQESHTVSEVMLNRFRRHIATGDTAAFETVMGKLKAQDRVGRYTSLGRIAQAVAAGDFKRAKKLLAEQRAKGDILYRLAPWLVTVVDGSKVKIQPKTAPAKPGVEQSKPAQKVKSAPVEPKTDDDWVLKSVFDKGKYTDVVGRIQANSNPSLYEQRLLADAYYNLQKWTKAVAGYRKVLSKHPGDEQIVQYLGDSLRRLKRFDESITFYQVLAKTNPDRPGFWRTIGDVARDKGDMVMAMWAYTRAVERGYTDDEINGLVEKLLKDSAKQSESRKR
jgi:predicted Zn-dependent protease